MSNDVITQIKNLGIKVGDTISGMESEIGWWQVSRLTLLWVGESIAVWRVTECNIINPEWTQPREVANWVLDHREWRKVDNE